MMYKVSAFLLAAVLISGGAQADILAYDNFDSYSASDPIVDTWGIGLTPDTGSDWIKSWVQPEKTSTVTNEVAYSGTNSQRAYRLKGTGTGIFTAIGTGVPIDVTKQYVFTSMYQPGTGQYALDNCGSNFISAGPSNDWVGGWNHSGFIANNADYFGVRNYGTYANVTTGTGFLPVSGNWYKMEMVVTIGADNGAGNYPITYDVFATNSLGSRIQLADNFNGYQMLNAQGIAHGWELNTGAGGGFANAYNLIYFDDVTISVIPEPMTLSLLGLGGIGLLRRFRK